MPALFQYLAINTFTQDEVRSVATAVDAANDDFGGVSQVIQAIQEGYMIQFHPKSGDLIYVILWQSPEYVTVVVYSSRNKTYRVVADTLFQDA